MLIQLGDHPRIYLQRFPPCSHGDNLFAKLSAVASDFNMVFHASRVVKPHLQERCCSNNYKQTFRSIILV